MKYTFTTECGNVATYTAVLVYRIALGDYCLHSLIEPMSTQSHTLKWISENTERVHVRKELAMRRKWHASGYSDQRHLPGTFSTQTDGLAPVQFLGTQTNSSNKIERFQDILVRQRRRRINLDLQQTGSWPLCFQNKPRRERCNVRGQVVSNWSIVVAPAPQPCARSIVGARLMTLDLPLRHE